MQNLGLDFCAYLFHEYLSPQFVAAVVTSSSLVLQGSKIIGTLFSFTNIIWC